MDSDCIVTVHAVRVYLSRASLVSVDGNLPQTAVRQLATTREAALPGAEVGTDLLYTC